MILAPLGTEAHAQANVTAADREEIAKLAGPEWIVKADNTAVTIESTFDVYFVQLISRMLPPPEFTHAVTPEELHRETNPEHYVIRLEYGPKVDHNEVESRVKERQKQADILNTGTKTKKEWGDAIAKFHAIRVPRYMGRNCSIYRVLPESSTIQVYPPSAVAKIGAIKELIDVVLPPLRNPYQ